MEDAILLDEYNDPPWPGCNLAVDEFLSNKPEKLMEISLGSNYQKLYFSRTSTSVLPISAEPRLPQRT
jgi:hypothetical protein